MAISGTDTAGAAPPARAAGAPRLRAGALAILALAVGATFAACSGEEPARQEDRLRVAIKSDIRGTNPGVSRDAVTDDVLLHVVEPLVAYRADFSVAPLLAERVDVSDDGRLYTFPLREGLRFHNGEPVTAAEVKWSWERMLDPATNWLCRGWYDGSQSLRIEAIETPDAATVAFRLNRPSGVFLDRIANLQCITAILHPDSVDERGGWRAPIGTGPFRLEEWRRGEHVRLTRFPDYAPAPGPRDGLAGARLALVDTLEWLVVPESAAARSGLLSGQIDLVYGLQASDLPDLDAPGIEVHRGQSLDWNALLIQTGVPRLDNPDLRRAIAHAIDAESLAEVVTGGISRPNPSAVARASRYYGDCHERGYEHDPALARALAEAAGYDGRSISLKTNKRFPNMYENALLIQAMLGEAGIEAELEVLEWTTQLDHYMNGNFELMTFGYSGRTDPIFAYEAILGDKSENAFVQWENAEALALVQDSGVERDPARRAEIFCAVHELMLADTAIVNLFNHYGIDATREAVQGYENWPAQKPRLWGVSLGPH